MTDEIRGSVRPVTQAGRFYPLDPTELRRDVSRMIEEAPDRVDPEKPPVGFVAPHAGYDFSGPTAGRTYKQLRTAGAKTVFVFAPSHHQRFPAASIWEGPGYDTPLGVYPVDLELVEELKRKAPSIRCERWAEEQEHSLEVQTPFLQVALPDAKMVPLLIGDQSLENIEKLTDAIGSLCDEKPGLRRENVAFVASSDAYHGHSLEECRASDKRLVERIEAMDLDGIYEDMRAGKSMACGVGAIAAVIRMSRRMGAESAELLHQTNSSEALSRGPGGYVVGYLSFMFY